MAYTFKNNHEAALAAAALIVITKRQKDGDPVPATMAPCGRNHSRARAFRYFPVPRL